MRMKTLMSATAALALLASAAAGPALAEGTAKTSATTQSSAALASDNAFVKKAAIGDSFEIQAGQLALERSQNDAVRQFAQQMIDQHTQSAGQLYAAASDAGLKWPVAWATGAMNDATGSISSQSSTLGTDTGTGMMEDSPVGGSRDPGQIGEGSAGGVAGTGDIDAASRSHDADMPQGQNAMAHNVKLDAAHEAMLKALKNAKGEGFDRLYLEQQAQAHAKALDLMQGYAASGANAELKRHAEDMSKAIEAHQAMLKKIAL